MKKIYRLSAIALALGGALFLQSRSAGVAEIQDKDRTGAPGSDPACNQAGCHGGGNFAAVSTVTLIDVTSQQLVTQYLPETDYIVGPAVVGVNNAAAGFQATAVFDDGSNAGVFSNPLPGLQIEDVEGRHIIEHSMPSPAGAWGVTWTSPPAGSGTVTFYMSGNAVNGNGSASGDQYAGTTLEVTENVDSVEEIVTEKLLNAYVRNGNEVVITLDQELIGATAELYDMQGRRVGQQLLTDEISTWLPNATAGQYILLVEKNGLQRSVHVMLR